jgi:hypothetical protein
MEDGTFMIRDTGQRILQKALFFRKKYARPIALPIKSFLWEDKRPPTVIQPPPQEPKKRNPRHPTKEMMATPNLLNKDGWFFIFLKIEPPMVIPIYLYRCPLTKHYVAH